jgi:hypothetical protein
MAFLGFEGNASPGRDAPNSDSVVLMGKGMVVDVKENNDYVL